MLCICYPCTLSSMALNVLRVSKRLHLFNMHSEGMKHDGRLGPHDVHAGCAAYHAGVHNDTLAAAAHSQPPHRPRLCCPP